MHRKEHVPNLWNLPDQKRQHQSDSKEQRCQSHIFCRQPDQCIPSLGKAVLNLTFQLFPPAKIGTNVLHSPYLAHMEGATGVTVATRNTIGCCLFQMDIVVSCQCIPRLR